MFPNNKLESIGLIKTIWIIHEILSQKNRVALRTQLVVERPVVGPADSEICNKEMRNIVNTPQASLCDMESSIASPLLCLHT